jgi:4-amino-4-deoxy-L-arabinose transferase-like glycosyltransferase
MSARGSATTATSAPMPEWSAWPPGRMPPAALVGVILVMFGIVWLAMLSYTTLTPPTDNIEQLTWIGSLEAGYYKHPPLPTWLFWLPATLFGATARTSYVVGAVCTLGTIALLWRLLSDLRGSGYALLALLAVLCIAYYNGRLYYYNHNVVLMWFVTASATLCWKAHSTRRLRWWVGLGVALGLGALAKYQIAVTVVCVLAFWLHQRGWRDPVARLGLLLAALISLLLFVPHLQWLRDHDFGPIHYALDSSLGVHRAPSVRWGDSFHWLADQVLNRAAPAWMLLGWAIYAQPDGPKPTPQDTQVPDTSHDQASRALLLIWGIVPLLFMPLVGLFAGADLQLQWGTPFLLFAVPAAMEISSRWVAWSRRGLKPALKAFVVIQSMLLLVSYLTSLRGPLALQDRHWRTFDGAALAAAIAPRAREALGGRICVVSGPGALAGAMALELPEHPSVLIDGRYDRSPWVDKRVVKTCGAVELSDGAAPLGSEPVGSEFPRLSWRIRPPSPTSDASTSAMNPAP